MKKRITIPDTDLSLCSIGLGTASAGIKWDGKEADRMFDTYLDMGGNLIDTARVYSEWVPGETGRSERVIGDWLRHEKKRNQVVIITKGGHPRVKNPEDDIHIPRMTPKDMREDLQLSLKTLGVDTIDIYLYHRDNLMQDVTEEIDVMEAFRKEGKIRYYGCSNWCTERMNEADQYARDMGYRGFIADESLMNLGSRYMKPMPDDTLGYIRGSLWDYHKSTPGNLAIPYTGTAGGFFHRFINQGEDAVRESPYYVPENVRLAERCKSLMNKYHATVSQILLAFFDVQPFQCVALYGPRNVEQLIDAMGALELETVSRDYEL